MQPANFDIELQEIAGAAIGWIPLEDRAYLHVSSEGRQDRVVITCLPDAGLDGENVFCWCEKDPPPYSACMRWASQLSQRKGQIKVATDKTKTVAKLSPIYSVPT